MKRIAILEFILASACGMQAHQASPVPQSERTQTSVVEVVDAPQQALNERVYQTLFDKMPPDEKAWERLLRANLGVYLVWHKEALAKGIADQWVFVRDDPKLPRVLLLGDSISIHYTRAVRTALTGKANVHRAPENCGSTADGLRKLDVWLQSAKWDVVHFNFGIHDIDTSANDYKTRLAQFTMRLQRTGAKLIWASSTPVPVKNKYGSDAAIVERNAIAARIMAQNGVRIDDLYTFILPQLSRYQHPNDVHFNEAGCNALGRQVAASIESELKQTDPSTQ